MPHVHMDLLLKLST